MDKTRLFIDESKAVIVEKGWDVNLEWLTPEALHVPYVDSFIATFTKLCNEQTELTQENASKLFDILKRFIDDIRVRKYKELLSMRYDPQLYMTDDELKFVLSDVLDKKLREAIGASQQEDDMGMEGLMKMFAAMQQPKLHQYAKKKKTKVARK